MEYLIIINDSGYYTNWYDYENTYTKGMIVINISTNMISMDGKEWKVIEFDNL